MSTAEVTTTRHEEENRPTNPVAIALIIITILEVVVGTVNFIPTLTNFLLIVFLSTKIYLVGAYYMGVKYEVKARYIVLFAFLFPLALASLISFLPLLG